MTALEPGLEPGLAPSWTSVGATLLQDASRLARVMLVAVPLGVVSVGVVARLLMFALARANPLAAGMTTDDGFTIDQFTLSGSANLVLAGVFFGALSGVCWVVLAPLKTPPVWFGRLSISVGAGVVVGSQLVHSDGVDFVFLDHPALLAVAMFVLLPVLHVLVLDLAASRVVGRDLLAGRAAVVSGGVLSLPMAPLLAVVALGRAAQLLARRSARLAGVVAWPLWAWLARGVLAVLFALAVADLAADVATLT